MLSGSQIFKEDIVLWADAHEFSDLVHLLEQVASEDFGTAHRLFDQTCEHRDCRTFASTVMAEQGENLTVIHLYIDAFDRSERW